MDPAWIGALSAFGGVIVGALAEVLRSHLAFRREKRWAAWEDARRRLEMIYEALEQLRESYAQGTGTTVHSVTTGTVPEQIFTTKVPWARLRMLVYLYRPDLIPSLNEVEAAGPKLGAAMARAVAEQTGRLARDNPSLDRVMARLNELNNAIEKMRDAIVAASRELEQKSSIAIGEDKSSEKRPQTA